MTEKSDTLLPQIRQSLDDAEAHSLSPCATKSCDGVRKKPEILLDRGYRQTFSVDADRVLNSLAYTRYIDKTQVFSLVKNDHITHRVLHVQLVSKIARTIGRFLKLNEDLIEAIALGHDIGHAPFGHDGERFLSELCRTHLGEDFHHNAQSVQFLEYVERKGLGWNLTLQTLDGILCHNGEIHDQWLTPAPPTTFDRLADNIRALKQGKVSHLTPMSLEGCVVRMADTIAYVGRDIEDAIRLGLISRASIPDTCAATLGTTNGTIVYSLVTDLLKTSSGEAHIGFSDKVSTAFRQLRVFNLEHIYMNKRLKQYNSVIRDMFHRMFESFLKDIVSQKKSSEIFTRFLKDMAPDYTATHRAEEIVRDFISGMTDKYFLRLSPENTLPDTIHI